jgi:hypothetical protein
VRRLLTVFPYGYGYPLSPSPHSWDGHIDGAGKTVKPGEISKKDFLELLKTSTSKGKAEGAKEDTAGTTTFG